MRNVCRNISIIIAASSAANVKGSSRCTLIRLRHTAPAAAHRVTSSTIFTGFLIAGFPFFENSVKATNIGGAIANVNPNLKTAAEKAAINIILSSISKRSAFSGNGTGVYSSASFTPDFSSSVRTSRIIAVKMIAEAGYIRLFVCIRTGSATADISGAKVVFEYKYTNCPVAKASISCINMDTGRKRTIRIPITEHMVININIRSLFVCQLRRGAINIPTAIAVISGKMISFSLSSSEAAIIIITIISAATLVIINFLFMAFILLC